MMIIKEESRVRKKLLSLALALALVFTCVPIFEGDVFAASPAVHISSVAARPGESVDLTISISGNPGITSIDFSLQYDSAQLELTAKQNGSLLGGTMNSQTLDKVPYYCGWINSLQKTNCTDNGVLMTLTFRVKDGASDGRHAVSFTKSSVTGYDADIRAVTFAAENGYIEVTGGRADSGTDGGSSSQTGGSSGIVTPITPTTPADTTDAAKPADQTGSDQTQDKDNTQTLTASQQKIIAKVKGMNIRFTSAKYNKSKKTYTIKFKKTDKAYRVDGYLIYKSSKKSSGFSKVGKTSKLTWTNKKPGKKGKTYYYKVRGYREVAGRIYYTKWSGVKKMTIR